MQQNVKIISFLLFLLLISSKNNLFAQQHIIPKPSQYIEKEGYFELSKAVIARNGNKEINSIITFFQEAIKENYDIQLPIEPSAKSNIFFSLDATLTTNEGYEINIQSDKININAATEKGLFWAVQTLSQMLDSTKSVHCATIKDSPQFGYRSNMLDVGRHFFSVDFIKKHIKWLSFYKINTFHWHLTEDQGWRIESKKYPKLTIIGAYRQQADGTTYGGFYTQEQIKDIVAFAQKHHVEIIPEIEMPGHSLAAIVAYPEFSCRKKQLEVADYWGVMNDVYCAGNDAVYQLNQDILEEVIALFPSSYIHIGGDEVPKFRWQHCDACAKKMKTLGLKDEHELQSYFVQRIQQYLQSKGKTMIGWDEILEGGANKNAVIEVWRGQEKAKEAIANGNKIIQTLYFDTPPTSLTLEKTFQFNPISEVAKENVLGAECPLWTEHVTEANAEYMLYPRLQAFAEVLWSGKTEFQDFKKRLEFHNKIMEKADIQYGAADKNLLATQIHFIPNQKKWRIDAQRGVENLQLYYYFEGEKSKKTKYFYDSLIFNKPKNIAINPMRNGKTAMLPFQYTMENHKAIGAIINFVEKYHNNYRNIGDFGLTDGICGNSNSHLSNWLGWWGNDLNVIVDLGQNKKVKNLEINCLQATQSWIILPKSVIFTTSEDGVNWTNHPTLLHQVPIDDFKSQSHLFSVSLPKKYKARYIKVVAENYGILPEWHNGAGGKAWIFADEIIVK
jgi:hexosaminidase